MDLLSECFRIARLAGGEIMRIYQSDFMVQHKTDASPLTEADLAAHSVIKRALHELTPDIPLLSEEEADIPYSTRSSWPRYWLVDPLDGTKEFIARNGEFTVNIALIDRDKPVLGVIYAPALNHCYGAARGHGALRIIEGQPEGIRTRIAPKRPVLLFSRSHREARPEPWLESVSPHDEVKLGSSLKFCRIATGEADFHARPGPTSEWDTAAGQCIVEEAGGAVVQLPEWTALRYNCKASLLNPGFAVLGGSSAEWKMLFD